jgi:hypothetical protein
MRRRIVTRRECLEIGGSAMLGLSWPALLKLRADGAVRRSGRAKSCVVLFLWGGPGQQDLWDLKPQAPAEVRGPYRPIATRVPGTHIGEMLPSLARQAHLYTLVRSVTHKDFEHGSAAYLALTGQPHPLPGTNTPARPEDFPTYASVVSRVRPAPAGIPSAVTLGPQIHQGNRPPVAGQNAGFLGQKFNPFRVAEDPSQPGFQVETLTPLEDLSEQRLEERRRLVQSLDHSQPRDPTFAGMEDHFQQAFEMLQSSSVRSAFHLDHEAHGLRNQYGWSRFGQTLLLARRLVEAGVPFITINWARQNADQWDTHKQNYPKLRELLPPFDQGLAAFLADLQDRGLLDSTLVYCLGEFGRTPRLNADAGRDHWPDCYTVVLAGGGVRRGEVVGASDRFAAYPVSQPVSPWDLAATLYHCLGIDPTTHVHDALGRSYVLSSGRVTPALLQ